MSDPIEKMKAAYNEEARRWTLGANGEIRRWEGKEYKIIETVPDEDEQIARRIWLSHDAAMRAAVLALAEAEPTREMFDAWGKEENECAVHNYGGHPSASTVFSIGCRAAAEQKKEQGDA